jgi:hypothetical protein
MRWTLLIACILFGTAVVPSAFAANVIVGVNVAGAQQMNEQQQDALVEQLQQNGVKTVRTGIGEKFSHFITRAYQRGIGAVVIIYPTQGSTNAQVRPADKSVGLQWAEPHLTDADRRSSRSGLPLSLPHLKQPKSV